MAKRKYFSGPPQKVRKRPVHLCKIALAVGLAIILCLCSIIFKIAVVLIILTAMSCFMVAVGFGIGSQEVERVIDG